MESTPPFEIAVEQFESFLRAQARPTSILWRHPDDMIGLRDGRVAVRRRSAAAMTDWAKREFEAGRARDVGIVLDATCELDGSACATVFWTDDEDKASRFLIPDRGLKLSVGDPLRKGLSIGGLAWWLGRRRRNVWRHSFSNAAAERQYR